MNRTTLKRAMPPALRRALMRLRDQLNGPGIDYDVLRDYMFVPDTSDTPRINLILPALSSETAFGGVTTGLTFFADLVRELAPLGVEARLITEAAFDPDDPIFSRYPALAGCDRRALAQDGFRLPTRARDIFVVFNWWLSLNIEPVLATQATHFSIPPRAKIYLIQEYEPHFYPFSSAHMLAREAMGARWPLWGVFNTHELYNFWAQQGHDAERAHIFEPRMNSAIRPFADNLTAQEKTRTVLVYGRPQVARNAFSLIERGLRDWAERYGCNHAGWRFVSAGMSHADIDLGKGYRLTSLGKLSLEEYGALMRETAIGLSLMISPHPSYPPLEMAHFGARVLTNSYPCKSPRARHDNLIALDGVRAEAISEALEAEIRTFETTPGVGLQGQTHMPDYLGAEIIDCIAALANDTAGALGLGQSKSAQTS